MNPFDFGYSLSRESAEQSREPAPQPRLMRLISHEEVERGLDEALDDSERAIAKAARFNRQQRWLRFKGFILRAAYAVSAVTLLLLASLAWVLWVVGNAVTSK